jgi:hypothetical protein
MIPIEKVLVGFPAKMASKILVRTMPIVTSATTCQLYYELHEVIETTSEEGAVSESTSQLANGNLDLTEAEFTAWGNTMDYIGDIALKKLGLTRKVQ